VGKQVSLIWIIGCSRNEWKTQTEIMNVPKKEYYVANPDGYLVSLNPITALGLSKWTETVAVQQLFDVYSGAR